MIHTSTSASELEQLVQQALERHSLPKHLDMAPEEASKGLVQLALTVVNLLRELMEKQAMRRMDKGNLTDEDVERMGQTFMLLEGQMDQLKELFDFSDDDLRLSLGNIEALD